ncbi:histidine phosphatase family protein [Caldilinea sp.]|uniref:histidine phosphatase family protein n=1 Tax=Caldilinea sp. TaxID=2293560 RepID=UPI002BBA2A72|nr:histidine phosphatase family protein [Caldilinea sp.]HRA64451.1 histidine phosphatase family protein [Caldilinea sp.]
MTELWLVRHGQTDWNLQRRYQGQTDPPLNATGLQQAELAGEALVGRRYAAIYSSDLQRARVTAEIIGRRLGMEVFVDSRLREVSFGKWEGMLVADIQTRYPVEWEARQQDRLYARPPGGESVQDVAARIWPAVDELAARHPHDVLILVSHGLALATILCRAQGLPLASARDLIPDNAQPHCIVWDASVTPQHHAASGL